MNGDAPGRGPLETALARFWEGEEGYWRLLDIVRDEQKWRELEAVARRRGCHEAQLAGLRDLLTALRELYAMAAAGDLEDIPRDEAVTRRFELAESRVRGVVGRFFYAFVPGYIVRCGRLVPVWVPVPGWNVRDEAVALPSVFVALGEPLSRLLQGLVAASRSTVFVCEACGKMGRARQHNKRFCGDTCRQRAYRASKREKVAVGLDMSAGLGYSA
jgi:hypothetical protein